MKINIQAPWEVNEYLDGVIRDKVGKLSTFNGRIQHIDIFLKVGDNVGQDDKMVEMRLRSPGPELFAQNNADSFEKAVAGVTEKMKVQLVKKKEKQQGR